MSNMMVAENIFNIGANDNNLKLFESQYNLKNGMCYNSYVIRDEKNAIFDTVDEAVTDIWIDNLEKIFVEKEPDYLIVSHMEPDHAYNLGLILEKYPNMKIVGNTFTFNIFHNFFDIDIDDRKIVVKEGDVLDLGRHKLQFFMAPMVHWPEVMVTYEQTEKLLFTADAFGKFGSLDIEDDWLPEARRYYFGIVGKYGAQVQALLGKVANLDIKMICPLHGPILKENLACYIEKYNTWSKYEPEENGVFIACSSIYGNTLDAANILAELLKENGEKEVVVMDIACSDWAEAVANAFKYSKLVLAASSYNAGLVPPMEQFLRRLKERNFQKRTVGIIENGSWAPSAGRCMKNILSEMKDIEIVEPMVTIKSKVKEENMPELKELAKALF